MPKKGGDFMVALTEKEILENISIINKKLEDDDKKGILSDAEYQQCCKELHDSQNNLRTLYIQRYLASKKETVELDMSLFPFYEEESDGNLETCKERF